MVKAVYDKARSGDPKGRSFRGTDEPLKDSETRLKPYERLSRGTKQSMDLDRREKIADLDAKADKYGREDLVYNIVSAPSRAAFSGMTGKPMPNQDRSTDVRRKADKERNWKPGQSDKFSDTTPEKLSKQQLVEKLSKGGEVRGYGAARKSGRGCKGA